MRSHAAVRAAPRRLHALAAPLTRARAARILEKYRDVLAGKGTGHAVSAARSSGSFANKRRIDAVVKALKACG